jgi:hypothetical protein
VIRHLDPGRVPPDVVGRGLEAALHRLADGRVLHLHLIRGREAGRDELFQLGLCHGGRQLGLQVVVVDDGARTGA